MELIILLIWMIWFTKTYRAEIKIGNKYVIAVMTVLASLVFFGVTYGISSAIVFLTGKSGVVWLRPLIGCIISLILFGLSLIDYKYNDSSKNK